jgi:hypothetical protein
LTTHRTHPSSIARRSKVTGVAPPGRLGIILANKADSKGTVVLGGRISSVLAEKLSPSDRQAEGRLWKSMSEILSAK